MLVISVEEKTAYTEKNVLAKITYGRRTSKNPKYPLLKYTDFKFRNKHGIINIYIYI